MVSCQWSVVKSYIMTRSNFENLRVYRLAEDIADAIACSPLGKGRPRPEISRRPVIIEDDVWIGPNAAVLKGVRIGAGAFVEAGSLATRDVPKTKSRAHVETLRTPPSSLDLNRAPSAARTGRHAIDENRRRHSKMAALTGGDVDADMESAYFTGDETPGGDNPTPDQNNVDEIGHAVGIEYGDNEELKGSDKVADRDKHRWENE